MAKTNAAAGMLVLLLVLALLGCGSGDVDIQDITGRLVSISVTPANPSLAARSSQQFVATGIYSDHTTRDITASVSWDISDAAVAMISNTLPSKGMATFSSAGATTITATMGGISGSTTVIVTPAALVSIAVSPVQPSTPRGNDRQFTAIGTYSDATTQDLTNTVTWSSSNTGVATISNSAGSKGLAAALATGTTTITALFGSVAGTTTLTVTPATLLSIAVTPVNPSIARGTVRQFTATGLYSDNTTQDLTAAVTWSSSDPSVASVSNTAGSRGAAAGLAVGTTAITAASGGVTGSTTLTVTQATLSTLVVTPANPSIARGTGRQFTATGTYSDNATLNLTDTVAWYSSNAGVATISNAAGSRGMAQSVATGTTMITAATGSVSGATTLTVTPATLLSITVTPVNPSIARGTTRQFTAMGTYSDSSTQDLTAAVTWSSSNTAVASVSNVAGTRGSASGLAVGTAAITAASAGVTGSTTLTVTAATLVSIAITPGNPSLAQGATQQFTATGTYTDGSTQNLTAAVTWGSSAATVASISNAAGSNGLATAIASGTATISATSGSVSSSTMLTVPSATPAGGSLAWDPPSTNADGTPFSNLAGYKLYYGTSTGAYTVVIDVGTATTYNITGFTPGIYYFAVTAYDTSGYESNYSNEVARTVQ